MIDHVVLRVNDLAASKAFYRAALAPLGYETVHEEDWGLGLGIDGRPDFWVAVGGTTAGVHVALTSPDRASVDAFYKAALSAGGTDNGGPGLRPHYHENYYAAFILDPDGNNVEAVCHAPA